MFLNMGILNKYMYIHPLFIFLCGLSLNKITLMCLIEGQALIKWQGGIFSKFNKRAGSNKEAGWNIFSNLIRGQERFVPYKRAGWKFNK